MEIKQAENSNKGAFYVEAEGRRIAEMTYSIAGTARIIIDHTEVDEVLKGKSAGKQLLAAVVEYARKNNLKVLPLCPFARSVFQRTREYDDVSDL
jgi:uncharacterized protein